MRAHEPVTVRKGLGLDERGSSALVMVLIVTAVLTMIGTVAMHVTSANVKSSGQYKNGVQSYYVAEAGIARARSYLAGLEESDVVSLLEDSSTLFANIPFGGGHYTVDIAPAVGFEGCGGESGEPLFELDGDGGVTTKEKVHVTFRALGSAITYGAGGPEIEVYAWASLNGGLSWIELYDGHDIDGGESETFEDIGPDSDIMLKVRAYYRRGRRTYYDKTYRSNDRSGHIYLLENGDNPPEYEPFDDQEALVTFLAGVIGSNGKVSIGGNDVVMLAELGSSLNSRTSDFQDAVILVEFERESETVAGGSSGGSGGSPCSGTYVKVTSTAELPGGSNAVIEAIMRKTGAGGGGAASANPLAVVMTAGPSDTRGRLYIDGRDHDVNGNLLGSGVLAVSSLSSFRRRGASRVAGTDGTGRDYGLTRNWRGLAALTEQYSRSWSAPSGPDELLGLSDGALKSVAQSAENGSQYVTNPSELDFPLSGVTYVELGNRQTWKPVHLGNSSGILVVHNENTNAVIKNLNSGSFTGVVIADDIVHIHTDIIGWVVTLTQSPSSGNCIGNGRGYVKFSRQAINAALETTQVSAEPGLELVSIIER